MFAYESGHFHLKKPITDWQQVTVMYEVKVTCNARKAGPYIL